jgi:hypothetical protein
MGFLLKAGLLQSMDSPADVLKLMKSDVKNNAGKNGVKFVAAKNFLVGGKPVNLFIVTDAPATFDPVLKLQPNAVKAQGTCDLVKTDGKVQVVVKKASGQIGASGVATLVPIALGKDASFTAIAGPAMAKPVGPAKPSQSQLTPHEQPEPGMPSPSQQPQSMPRPEQPNTPEPVTPSQPGEQRPETQSPPSTPTPQPGETPQGNQPPRTRTSKKTSKPKPKPTPKSKPKPKAKGKPKPKPKSKPKPKPKPKSKLKPKRKPKR